MQEINYLDVMGVITDKMANGGVFLSVPGNTMTIGWGFIGYTWKKPVFVAMVRPQRHTFALLKQAGEFTVSVPLDDSMREQLVFAGTKSGADVDKFDGHGITAAPAQKVKAPIVAECGLHLECKVLMQQVMPIEGTDEKVLASCYPGGDMHMMFFGEIVACYKNR